jgi:hypothetical protein
MGQARGSHIGPASRFLAFSVFSARPSHTDAHLPGRG